MKQHITIEQLNELSIYEGNKLEQWLIKSYPKFQIALIKEDYKEKKCFRLPLLSIGQMIEFLDENEGDFDITTVYIDYGSEYIDHLEYKLWNGNPFRLSDLCDALWEAVKEVLNKNETK